MKNNKVILYRSVVMRFNNFSWYFIEVGRIWTTLGIYYFKVLFVEYKNILVIDNFSLPILMLLILTNFSI